MKVWRSFLFILLIIVMFGTIIACNKTAGKTIAKQSDDQSNDVSNDNNNAKTAKNKNTDEIAKNNADLTSQMTSDFSLEKLDILNKGFPRFFWFRDSEATFVRRRPDGLVGNVDAWMAYFSQFDGFIGKVLDEELPSSAALSVFQQYKKQYPNKIVLLHYNGYQRRVKDMLTTNMYFPGHWQYHEGCKGFTDIQAVGTNTTITVEKASLFGQGDKDGTLARLQRKSENLLVCALDADGKPDWYNSEEVYLISKDDKNNTITVKRGHYGTEPKSFTAGKYVVLPHAGNGAAADEWIWKYNFSLDCPRDKNGKNATDVLVDELGGYFETELAMFDGVEFDVMQGSIKYEKMPIDTNGDLIPDNGIINGVDRYLQGAYEFAQKLRTRLGPNKLIMGDGQSIEEQRNIGILNGIESEGWPIMRDTKMEDWSGGMNRMLFWNSQTAYHPVFNYMVVKARVGAKDVALPASYWRLFNAVAVATGSAVSGSVWEDTDINLKPPFKLFDELVKGEENDLSGWLGMPLGEVVRLAKVHPDLLKGTGITLEPSFISKFTGDGLSFTKDENRMKVQSTGGKMKFRMVGIDTTGINDLTVFCKVKASPLKEQNENIAKAIYVRAYDSKGKKINEFGTLADGIDFEASFYFKNLKTSSITLEFEAEDDGELWISEMTIHGVPDAFYREFEKGLVIANPADNPYTFSIEKLPGITAGSKYRKIKGTLYRHLNSTEIMHDSVEVNDGKPVNGDVTLINDALFLAKESKK